MGTVPIGTGELRRIHSRVSWMFLPVDRSITVSAPQRVAHRIFSTSSSMDEATAELPMLALIFTRNLRPMIIGSVSGWLTLEGMIARPRATSSRTTSGATPGDPGQAKWRQAELDVGLGLRVGPRAAGVVETHRRLAAVQADLAHGYAQVGTRAEDVDLPRCRLRHGASLRWY